VDVERALICKIIQEKALGDATDYGIRPHFFKNRTNREVFQTIVAHSRDYSEVPSVRVMERDFPDYKFTRSEESMVYLMDEVRKNHSLSVYQKALNQAVAFYDDEDPESCREVLLQALGSVANDVMSSRDVDVTATVEQRLERYASLRNLEGGLRGIPSGFPTIDRATQGFQAKQLTTMVGPPKAGKSTMMLIAAMSAHLMGLTPLFIGFEMTNEEQEERLDAICAHVSHHRLRNGSLTAEEEARLRKSMHMFAAMKPFIFSNDTMSTTTLSGIDAKVTRYNPDIVFIDGTYMMDDEEGEDKGSPQALTNITRGMKRQAQNRNIPYVNSTQVLEWKMSRKKGITSNSIGYASSFAQDSDHVIGVEHPMEAPYSDDDTMRKVKIVLSRNTRGVETMVRWDWETGEFDEVDEVDPYAEERENYHASY
jgi:replicative DNA helicase